MNNKQTKTCFKLKTKYVLGKQDNYKMLAYNYETIYIEVQSTDFTNCVDISIFKYILFTGWNDGAVDKELI